MRRIDLVRPGGYAWGRRVTAALNRECGRDGVATRTVARPAIKNFKSMQELFKGQEPVPEDSVWHANWKARMRDDA